MEDRYCVSCECYLKPISGSLNYCLKQDCNLYRVAQIGLSDIDVMDSKPLQSVPSNPVRLPPPRQTEPFTKTS